MIQNTIAFQNEAVGLSGILRLPDETGTFPIAILCHGLKGNKDRDFMHDLAMELTYAGVATLAFDFFGHGESNGSFERMTITQEVKDLAAAVQFVQTIPQIDKDRIAIIGHSFGGMIALLFTAEQHKKSVQALGILASPCGFEKVWKRFFQEEGVLQWRKEGTIALQGLYPLRKDMLLDSEQYTLLTAVSKISCPTVIMHGTADMRVPLEDARILYGALQSPKELEIIDGADHNFTDRTLRKEMIGRLIGWLRRVV